MLRRWSTAPKLALSFALAVSLSACKEHNTTGELSSPKDAAKFEGQYHKAFDDDYTDQNVNLEGRAPNDVLDQRLFAERMGFADVLAIVTVQQVFGKGRYQGRKDQYVAVSIDEVVLGTLPKGTEGDQLLVVKGEGDLPADLDERRLLLFLKWAPGEAPSYHHHLMPADEDLLEMIGAMVKHAQSEGVLGGDGEIQEGRKARRGRKKKEKKAKGEEKKAKGEEKSDPPGDAGKPPA